MTQSALTGHALYSSIALGFFNINFKENKRNSKQQCELPKTKCWAMNGYKELFGTILHPKCLHYLKEEWAGTKD